MFKVFNHTFFLNMYSNKNFNLPDFFQKMPMRTPTYSDTGEEFANDGTLTIGSLTSVRGVRSLVKIYF